MTVTHRIGDDWIMAYAAGGLSFGEEMIVASHLSYLPDAKSSLSIAEEAGGALLEKLAPATMSPDALAQTLARLGAEPPTAEAVAKPAARGVLPAPLASWLGRDVDELGWSFLGPGMRKVMLWRGGNDERLWMLRARAGVRIPDHGHSGSELVLVLKGSISDPHGRFGIGDIEETDTSDFHGLEVGPEDGECICLALTHGPVRFRSLVAKLMQPFIGL